MASEPRPWEEAGYYEAFRWPENGAWRQLTARSASLELNLVELIGRRETRRDFERPLNDQSLGEFLWLACRNRSIRASEFGVPQESRAHPSAGAMHPIHTLISSPLDGWEHYDPIGHRLVEVPGSKAAVTKTLAAAMKLVNANHATLLALIAEPGKTAAKYEFPESLVWRDGGVVLGYMSLVAEALGLQFCPLGLTGHPCVLYGWGDGASLIAVSLALVGAAPKR